jgi:MFS family permease
VEAAETVQTRPELYRNSNFVLLWTGQFISQVGDRLAMVALPWLIYGSTHHSAFSTGAMFALYTLPYVLFGTVAGAFIDRLDKRRVMVAADVARAGLVLAVPFVAEWSLAGVFVLAFVISSVAVFFDPCKLAILPDLVTKNQLVRANSLLATGETLTETVGYALAGFIVYYLARKVVFGIDAGTFVVSALALLTMRYAAPLRQGAELTARNLGREMREGLSFLRHHSGLLANTVLVVASIIGIGAVYPLTFLFAVRVLHGGTAAFGIMEASLGAGFFVGSLLMAALGRRVRKGVAMTAGLALMGGGFTSVAICTSLALVVVPIFVAGAANAAVLISIDTYFQQAVPEALRGRLWGTRFTITQSVFAASVLAGGALAAVFPVASLFIAAGLITAVPGLVGLFVPRVRDV